MSYALVTDQGGRREATEEECRRIRADCAKYAWIVDGIDLVVLRPKRRQAKISPAEFGALLMLVRKRNTWVGAMTLFPRNDFDDSAGTSFDNMRAKLEPHKRGDPKATREARSLQERTFRDANEATHRARFKPPDGSFNFCIIEPGEDERDVGKGPPADGASAAIVPGARVDIVPAEVEADPTLTSLAWGGVPLATILRKGAARPALKLKFDLEARVEPITVTIGDWMVFDNSLWVYVAIQNDGSHGILLTRFFVDVEGQAWEARSRIPSVRSHLRPQEIAIRRSSFAGWFLAVSPGLTKGWIPFRCPNRSGHAAIRFEFQKSA